MIRKFLAFSIILLTAMTAFFQPASAQNMLAGVTSNGGPEGKGALFTVNTDGSNYTVIKSFADYGKTPYGNLLKADDGNFYGMTNGGGTYGYGTIFKMTASGSISVIKQFNYSTDGGYPEGELIKGADGALWGMTRNGGVNGYGTIFSITTDGTFTVKKNFSYTTDGSSARGHLTLGSDGNYYGITSGGGSKAYGTIFKLTPAGVYTVLRHMARATDGGNSYSSLTEASDGNLYGTTYYGGTNDYGTIFSITKSGAFTVLKHLNSADGTYPQSDLIQATDGNLYGTCYGGGSNGNGTIFKITTAGVYTILRNMSAGSDGAYPYGGLIQNSDGALYGIMSSGGSSSYGTIYKITTSGAYTTLHHMIVATEGGKSYSALVKGNDGNLYAMTSTGGTSNMGTVFKVSATGAFTLLASLNGAIMGNDPEKSLMKGKDSAYYITNAKGGGYGYGSIIKICGGQASVLYSFDKYNSGGTPKGNLLQASDGNFYGTTYEGGANGSGTIFRITSGGTYTVLRSLSGSTDGYYPQGSLIQGKDGLLYGTTSGGGANSNGTIFKISTAGAFAVVRSLVYSTDGGSPQGDLLQASDGNFYGTTSGSTAKVFKLAADGTFSILYNFVSTTGYYPSGNLIQAKDGNLYGTCSDGGANSAGVIFQLTLAGVYKNIKSLSSLYDGRSPKGALVQGADGMLYGTTSIGGTYGFGTVFKISTSGAYTVLRQLNMDKDGGNPYGNLIFAPVNNLIANAQSVTTQQDKAIAVTLTGSGGGSLSYTLASQPKNGIITGSGANRIYTPNAGFYGIDSFYFSVSTGCLASSAAKVSITVTQVTSVNHAPVLNTISNKTVAKNKQLKFTATATDTDAGQILKYSLLNAPAGAKINASTGIFTWKPTVVGTYQATIRVTDNGTPAMYDEETITITVTATLTAFDKSADRSKLSLTNRGNNVVKATLYPNPVHNVCYLQLNAPSQVITIFVVDAKGSVVVKKNVAMNSSLTTSLDVSELANGVYFLLVETENGNQSLPFVKQ